MSRRHNCRSCWMLMLIRSNWACKAGKCDTTLINSQSRTRMMYLNSLIRLSSRILRVCNGFYCIITRGAAAGIGTIHITMHLLRQILPTVQRLTLSLKWGSLVDHLSNLCACSQSNHAMLCQVVIIGS